MNEAKIEELLNEGVSIIDPENTYIAIDVKIGKDTVIYPGCVIKAGTSIGENCIIGHYSLIDNSKICDNVEIKPFSCIFQSVIKNFSTIGPFSHLRPNSVLAEKTKVGNFSEVKKSIIGRGSKVPHLSYIGDSEIGEGVNIGAGTITCNYDGKEKHKTIIEDGAFIGSNTNLVAPVRVGKRALIGAGSTITEDIPDDKLAIARAKQVIKEKRIK
jgi:bifunctional UDP-N-acetylglucosamine pyrophosphorylase/glucosamine-1-phosphate N-acetyltransferase